MKAIKITLINIKSNLKEQAQDWRDNWSVLVNTNSQKLLLLEWGWRFKLEEQDEPRVNPKYPAYYTLL